MTEKEKMLAGEFYNAMDPQLMRDRLQARKLLRKINRNHPRRYRRLMRLERTLINAPPEGFCWIEPPFFCDYGYNITVGKDFYANFDCVFLDVNTITIGNDVMMGPKVQIYSATHPLDPIQRNEQHKEMGKPIVIGDGAWIGGGSIICPGVTIGANSVIGAGSIVTKDIPANVLAVGNPCRVIKNITEGN